MFKIAQWFVRHKVLVVAVGAAGFIFFGGNGKDEAKKPANPWSVQAQAPDANAQFADASAKKDSLTAKAYSAVAGAAKKYANVDIGGVNPTKLKDANDANWKSAEDGMSKANGQ